jgi:YVTN family beta-propeller protein
MLGKILLELHSPRMGKKIYVTSLRGNTTSVIDTSTNKVIANVSVGESPDDVAVTPDGNSTYLTNL